jgi:hypothetical protein
LHEIHPPVSEREALKMSMKASGGVGSPPHCGASSPRRINPPARRRL